MKKFTKIIVSIALCLVTLLSVGTVSACKNNKNVIRVCASEVPHAEVLESVVASILKEKGYTLKVSKIDWTTQNDAVAQGDYDANYFQHVPYLQTYNGKIELFAVCKVHYEPLGIYYGKAAKDTAVTKGKTFAICDDESNAVRALQLLEAKGVINKQVEGENYPINDSGEKLNFAGNSWENKAKTVKVTLIAENLLVASKADYDFALLPCNTAYTGNVSSEYRAAVEDDALLVEEKANIIAARKGDYKNDSEYKAKIDALADAMLSKEVSDFFKEKYLGSMTCDSATQIDLRKDV